MLPKQAPAALAVQSTTPARARLTPLAFAIHIAFAAALTAGFGGHAQAQASTAITQYDIPAGPLAEALNRFAQQSGVAIVVDANKVRGLRTQGLKGSHGVDDGFNALLRGSGHAIGKTAAGYVLVPVAAPAQKQEVAAGDATLPTVKVKASIERETATGPVVGYVAKRSATGTKTDTPLIETPQAIAVVTAEQMATLQAQSLGDALAYTPGVISVAGYSKSYDNFYSRGFALRDDSGSVVRDGLKFGGSGWATGQQEPYGLERVELLKGAASVLYGAAAPGGVLNTVSKRPAPDMVNEVKAGLGNYGHREIAADLGGAASPGSDWSWRVTALARNGNTHVDFIPSDTRYLAPALKWQPSAATSLTLLAYAQERHTAYYYPLPVAGTLLPSPYGTLPRNRFIGEPGHDREDTRQHALGYVFEHAFSDATRLHHALRYLNSENRIRFTGLDDPVASNPRLRGRTAYDEVERTQGIASDTSVEHRWASGALTHTLLAGVDYSRFKPQSQWSTATLAPLNLFQPSYGAPIGPMTREDAYSTQNIVSRVGLYAQDQMKLNDRWVLLLGGRQDWARNETSPLFGTPQWSTERSKAFTGRAGAVYLADNGLAPFVSLSQSFEPQRGTDASGQRFKPTTGEQVELGLRWQPAGENGLMLSASTYQLTQQNVVTSDPSQPRQRVQTGEVRARGLEFEAKGRIGRHLNLIASYAYTDAHTTKSRDAAQIGQRSPLVPRHQAALWLDTALAPLGLSGWNAGLGLRHTGSYSDVRGSNATVPSSSLIDLRLGWQAGPWQLALNLANLTDKTTLACGSGDCTYGEGRRVTASVGYRW